MASKTDEKTLDQKINDIHDALCGNVYNKEGIIEKVNRHDKVIGRHQFYFSVIICLGSIFVLVAAFWSDIKSIL